MCTDMLDVVRELNSSLDISPVTYDISRTFLSAVPNEKLSSMQHRHCSRLSQ